MICADKNIFDSSSHICLEKKKAIVKAIDLFLSTYVKNIRTCLNDSIESEDCIEENTVMN